MATGALDKSLRLQMVNKWLQTWHGQRGHMSRGKHTYSCQYCTQQGGLADDSKHTST